MKNKMVLAAVLLATSLQVGAKAERLDDFLKKENFKGISRLDYNTLTPAERDRIYAMAFSALLNARDAARGVLNKHFGKLDWGTIENIKRDRGLNAVKEYFITLSPDASGNDVFVEWLQDFNLNEDPDSDVLTEAQQKQPDDILDEHR